MLATLVSVNYDDGRPWYYTGGMHELENSGCADCSGGAASPSGTSSAHRVLGIAGQPVGHRPASGSWPQLGVLRAPRQAWAVPLRPL